MNYLIKSTITFLFISSVSGLASAVQSSKFADDLSYVMFDINGVRRIIKPQQTLQLVRGDRLRIVEAGIVGREKLAKRVNLVGFHDERYSKIGDDLNVDVNTDRSLLRGYAQGEFKNIYRVVASSGVIDHGQVYIQVLKPELRFVTVLVNEEERVLREGNLLKLTSKDIFKVKTVNTNVSDQDAKVTYEVRPMTGMKQLKQVSFYVIQFKRNGRDFAEIPVQIEEI